MSRVRIGVAVAALVLNANVLVAQQRGDPRPPGGQHGMMGDSAMVQRHMRTMDSLNANLNTLVRRMDVATGNQKVAAMADVLHALVAERRMMHEHMRQMMGPGHGKQPRRGNRQPISPPASSAADTAHAGHHPPK